MSSRFLDALLGAFYTGLAAVGCLPPTPTPVPTVRHDAAGTERSDTLVVFLPGRGDRAGTFADEGFVEILSATGHALDAIAVDAHIGYYFDRSVGDRLLHDVVEPARARGYRSIWLVGISMGGLGAFILAREHPGVVDGIIAIAPFLGPARVPREVRNAGGLRSWRPDRAPDDYQKIWEWLRGYAEPAVEGAGADRPELYLAFGETDRFADDHRLLAEVLPPDHVFTVPGGHQWEPWRALWTRILGVGVLP